MGYITKPEAILAMQQLPDGVKLCPWCYAVMETVEREPGETVLVCSNDMCLYDEDVQE